ncbi:sugar phosphate isomerase/epimerase family protein [Aquiflexum gelatinilyticum]|uniref:sugar phosphate isomerase/epimerase family protein n=1 Tax=Aquiflexum gelatinilyticum TaxID=2961943 RepID=UPI00216A417D|nr:sugar phosphate isomerase/epimerase family protein [Aquiflexum gelatinilyticum]MCS4435842.1 sugar phosphate isomerase/epimerase [Aquiflexum gelatinilyticum]
MTHRRNFLKSALPIGLGLGVLPIQDVFGAQSQSFDKSPSSKIKVGLNAWSYYVQLYKYQKGEAGGMSLFDMLEECTRLEFDAVDPTGYFFPGYPNRPERKFINEFKQRAFQLGLGISGTGIRNDFATADKVKRSADVALAKVWIEVAAEMGAPVLRVFAGVQPKEHTWDETSVWVAEALAECAEYGKQFGVMIGVQNHGDMLKSADEVIKILDMVDSDWLGTIVDTGFFLTPDPYADIARVIPYAVNWQVKELLSDRKGGKIDMNKLVAIIRDSNYRGYVPIETLPDPDPNVPYDAMTKVPELLGDLRKALS